MVPCSRAASTESFSMDPAWKQTNFTTHFIMGKNKVNAKFSGFLIENNYLQTRHFYMKSGTIATIPTATVPPILFS